MCSTCKAAVTSVRSLSRCHSSDAEDALYHGHGQAQGSYIQLAQGPQLSQPSQEPCSGSLQSLEDFLASTTTSEHLQEPLLYGGYDERAMEGSCASSQSDESFLSLMLGPGGLSSQQSAPASPAAVPALPTHCLLRGAGTAARAEQPSMGDVGPCSEASPESADPMLDDMFLHADSSDGSADWFSSAQAQPCVDDLSMQLQPSMQQQQAAQPLVIPSRKRGRPRRYDTTLPFGEPGQACCSSSTLVVTGAMLGVCLNLYPGWLTKQHLNSARRGARLLLDWTASSHPLYGSPVSHGDQGMNRVLYISWPDRG